MFMNKNTKDSKNPTWKMAYAVKYTSVELFHTLNGNTSKYLSNQYCNQKIKLFIECRIQLENLNKLLNIAIIQGNHNEM